MQKVNTLNEHIEMCFKLWNGEIAEDEFEQNRTIYVSEEVDKDMQIDSFY